MLLVVHVYWGNAHFEYCLQAPGNRIGGAVLSTAELEFGPSSSWADRSLCAGQAGRRHKWRTESGMGRQNDAQEPAEYIPFDEFRDGLSQGRFRVIVNPTLAAPFVAHRTHATQMAIAIIGLGIAAALAGSPWISGVLVTAGILLRRAVKTQAPRILLHIAARVPLVYEQATEHGVMEVRRA